MVATAPTTKPSLAARPWNPETWIFDIDRCLNRFVPPPPWRHIPYPIAYFLGHRKTKPRDIGTIVPILWAFVGVFCAIALIIGVSERIPSLKHKGAPIIIGSFGAGAVLEFYTIDSPLAQPRNFLVSQTFAACLGMGICKLFLMSPDFESLRWLAAAISCAVVTSLMALTKTVHPPAGATALLAIVDQDIVNIGWFYIPVVLLNCGLMLGVALVVNNVQRVYPAYWWTPEDLRKTRQLPAKDSDEESQRGQGEKEMVKDGTDQGVSREIIIRPGKLIVPDHIYLMQEEVQLLEEIRNRL